MRLRLLDFRLSDAARQVGLCSGDIASVANLVNRAQERLVQCREAGQTGWWGGWAKMAFNVSVSSGVIVQPREVARIQNLTVCNRGISIQNEFYEMLDFGIGLQPLTSCCSSFTGSNCQFLEAYERGTFPTFSDIGSTNKTLRIYPGSSTDVGKRVLVQGLDVNGNPITSFDGLNPTVGEFVTLGVPFAQFPGVITSITGIQKDITNNPVSFYEVDLTTNATRLILTMAGGEETANYGRLFINGLPANCCGIGSSPQVMGMAKLELIPARVDTDWLLIQSLEALIAEAQAVRFSTMDSPSADKKAAQKHHEAIGFLNGQLNHYLGVQKPAVLFKPFGSANLERQMIGRLT